MAASGKLDQSLDDILKTERRTGGLKVGRGRGGRRGGTRNTAAAVAPVGGIKKNAKQAKSTAAIPTGPAIVSSKVQISNLVSISAAILSTYAMPNCRAAHRSSC